MKFETDTYSIYRGFPLQYIKLGIPLSSPCVDFTMCIAALVFCVLCYYLVCNFVTSCVLFYCVCIAVLHTLFAGLLARSQYPGGPATGHLGTGFSWFPCVYKRMLRWLPTLQVATACF